MIEKRVLNILITLVMVMSMMPFGLVTAALDNPDIDEKHVEADYVDANGNIHRAYDVTVIDDVEGYTYARAGISSRITNCMIKSPSTETAAFVTCV